MKKIFITKEQIEALEKANDSVRGTSDYGKYYSECEWKNDKGFWKYVGHGICHAGYLKKVRGEIFIYEEDSKHRYRLTPELLSFFGITPETFNPPKKIKKEKKPAPQKTLKQELRGLDPLEKRNYLKFRFNTASWEFIFYILPCDPEYQDLLKDPDFHEGDFSPLYEMGFDSWEQVRELALECAKENIKNENYDSRKIIQRINKIMNIA